MDTTDNENNVHKDPAGNAEQNPCSAISEVDVNTAREVAVEPLATDELVGYPAVEQTGKVVAYPVGEPVEHGWAGESVVVLPPPVDFGTMDVVEGDHEPIAAVLPRLEQQPLEEDGDSATRRQNGLGRGPFANWNWPIEKTWLFYSLIFSLIVTIVALAIALSATGSTNKKPSEAEIDSSGKPPPEKDNYPPSIFSDLEVEAPDQRPNNAHLDSFTETAKLFPRDGAAGSRFGWNVAIHGDTLVIAAPYHVVENRTGSGSAYVYVRDTVSEEWMEEATLLPRDGSSYIFFGVSVAIHGDTVVVGGVGTDGSAYVFVRDSLPLRWREEATLTNQDGFSRHYGFDVAIHDDTVVIGSFPYDDFGDVIMTNGSVYVFARHSYAKWTQQARLLPSDRTEEKFYCPSLDIFKNTVIIGVPKSNENGYQSGAVYIFVREEESIWREKAKLVPSDVSTTERFGDSVAIYDDTVVFGTLYVGNNDGAGVENGLAYVFVRDDESGDWTEQATLATNDAVGYNNFVHDVAVYNATVVVGDPKKGSEGIVHVFTQENESGKWSEQLQLNPSEKTIDHNFGRKVGIHSDTVIVGAWDDDDNGDDSGSAYIFSLPPLMQSPKGGDLSLALSDEMENEPSPFPSTIHQGYSNNENVDDNTDSSSIENDQNKAESSSLYSHPSIYPTIMHSSILSSLKPPSNQPITSRSLSPSNQPSEKQSIPLEVEVVNAQPSSSPMLQHAFQSFTEVAKLLPNDGDEDNSFGFSIAIHDDTVVVGARYNIGNTLILNVSDDVETFYLNSWVYIFVRDEESGEWAEDAKLFPSDGAPNDLFGASVAIHRDTVVVGAYHYSPGSVYVFVRNQESGDWVEEAKLLASDGAVLDNFGNSVGVYNDTVVVESYRDVDNWQRSGSVYVFVREKDDNGGTIWTEEAKLLPDSISSNYKYGRSVGIFEHTVVVGGLNGSAYIFSRQQDSGVWTQKANLVPSDGSDDDNFGQSIAIHDDIVVVGTILANNNVNEFTRQSGAAYVFVRNQESGDWTEQAILRASESGEFDYFGVDVAVYNNTIFVGTLRNGAYVFTRINESETWTKNFRLLPSDGAQNDYFGKSVGLYGDTAIVGAPGDDDNGKNSGSAYIFSFEPLIEASP